MSIPSSVTTALDTLPASRPASETSSLTAAISTPAPGSGDAPSRRGLTKRVAVIGAGPAGLMAAERLAAAGAEVDVYDAMPSVGRKFLMAGKGGMNLTHAEPYANFLTRYGARQSVLTPMVDAFTPTDLREWVHGLGVDTFVGSSGRVFPSDMKAAPMLRTWLHRLRTAGVRFHMRHRWLDWQRVTDDNTVDASASTSSPLLLQFSTPEGDTSHRVDAVVLALGGASWPRLGSDATWVPTMRAKAVPVSDFAPANCGFETVWTPFFMERYAGQALKNVALRVHDTSASADAAAPSPFRQGECMITRDGIEGGLIYALSASIRERITRDGEACVMLDLLPSHSPERVRAAVTHPRGKRSLSSHLQSGLGLTGVKTALLYECLSKAAIADAAQLAVAIKALPLKLQRPRPIAEAISSAGGVSFDALTSDLMLRDIPGVFCCGEMLDWEAPTGGYLLTACFASGRQAGSGVLAYWQQAGTDATLPPMADV